jgi:hypothetical protein
MNYRVLITSIVTAIFLPMVVFGQSFSTVLGWMYENGLTKYQDVAGYRGQDFIVRGEVSKLFSNYAALQGLTMTKSAEDCAFNDTTTYDETLQPTIIDACRYGLVKGHNGNYYPNNSMTEAEALTVIVRSILGNQDETLTPRWKEYYEIGKWLDILDGEELYDLERKITREKVGTWLYRASQVDEEQIKSEGTDELKTILEDIFGEEFWQ